MLNYFLPTVIFAKLCLLMVFLIDHEKSKEFKTKLICCTSKIVIKCSSCYARF